MADERKTLAEVQLETALLELDEARDRNARIKAEKADKSRKNKQRQDQLATDRNTRAALAEQCNHRQGGSPRNPYQGKGDSALFIAKMPDGFTRVVGCGICRGRWWNPHPADGAKAQRPGESADEAKTRVARHKAAGAKFEEMLAKAKDKLSDEAAQEMDCGVTISVTNAEGVTVIRRRPCDSYAA